MPPFTEADEGPAGKRKHFLSAATPNIGGHCACLTSRKLWPSGTSWPHPPMPSDRFVLSGRWGVTLCVVACRQVRPGSTGLLLTCHAAERERARVASRVAGWWWFGCVLLSKRPKRLCVCVHRVCVCLTFECVNSNYKVRNT